MHFRAFVFALAVPVVALASGCSGSPEEGSGDDRGWGPEEDGPNKAKGGACAPMTCGSAGKACGTHDDGCGGTIDCGTCVDGACKPKTCEELGKTSGKHDDGCGGQVDCGAGQACTPDAKAGNTSSDKASDLGAMTDTPESTANVASLSVGEGEEDWFKFKVTDAGFGGNPRVDVTTSGTPVEVGVFYVCDSAENYSECPTEGEKVDTTIGKGCVSSNKASVWTSCDGTNESGTAYVRVRKVVSGAAGECSGYGLDVKVVQDF